jgi:CDP-glucose 4,6-dehydratase
MTNWDRVWRSRTVLCTGATGMVGGWVVNALLEADARVVALVRDTDYRVEFFRSGAYRQVAIVHGDLQDYSTIERAINQYEVDTVIHLGAQALVMAAERSPLETFESNIRGTYNLLEACRVHRDLVQRVAIASSDKAYGDNNGAPYTEDLPLVARHPYDVSKTCADLLAQTYAYTYELPVTIARCGNIFGGGDLNWSRLVPGTIRSLLADQTPPIRSDGSYVRDFLYVKDAAAAYLNLAEHAGEDGVRGEAFNFSPESPRTVLELVDCLAGVMNKRHLRPRILNQAKHEIPHQVLSAQKARTRLGWRPRYSLELGLTETVAWYARYLQTELAAA